MGQNLSKSKKPNDKFKNSQKEPYKILEELEIVDPNVISLLMHTKKSAILELLLVKDKTIMILSKETGWNPGTIKRHLIDLIDGGLVVDSRIELNKHRIMLKFYRATAKSFTFQYKWPPGE